MSQVSDATDAKDLVPVVELPGAMPLGNPRHEHYCRLRALLRPKMAAYRDSGFDASTDHMANANGARLERRQDVRDRIAFLTRQEEEVVAEKRKRIEEALWLIHECDIGLLWETYDDDKRDKAGMVVRGEDGKPVRVRKQRPRLLSDLTPEVRMAIEAVQVDEHGRVLPRLYSKLAAGEALRKMLGIGNGHGRSEDDLSRMSDQQLLETLTTQARELGIEINLNYRIGSERAA